MKCLILPAILLFTLSLAWSATLKSALKHPRLPVPTAQVSPNLQFSIAAQKPSFQLGEPVSLIFTLENNGTRPAWVDTRFLLGPSEDFGEEISLLITGPREQPVPYLALFEPSPLENADVAKIAPKQSAHKTLTLSNVFTLTNSGMYLVQAIYDTTEINSELPMWRGRLISQPITFMIEDKK